MNLTKEAMVKMYNLQNAESEVCVKKLEELLPHHPASPFLRALNIYWKQMPIHSKHPDFGTFISLLQETLVRSDQLLKHNKNNEEAIFFSLAAHGYLAQYYADEKSILKAIRESKSAYYYMKLGFTLLDQNPEFYYTTGLYNFYREQYPEMHPLYKPFMWFFASGNKQLGLQQLDVAIREAVFTRVEALQYTSHINLRYEINPGKAEISARLLIKEFPMNYLFKGIYVETMLALEKFNEANLFIQQLQASKNPYFNMMGNVYMGIFMEKKEKNYEQAISHFNKALEISSTIPIKTDHIKSLAWCGLGRINSENSNHEAARDYYKKAYGIAQYPSVKNEAADYLHQSKNY